MGDAWQEGLSWLQMSGLVMLTVAWLANDGQVREARTRALQVEFADLACAEWQAYRHNLATARDLLRELYPRADDQLTAALRKHTRRLPDDWRDCTPIQYQVYLQAPDAHVEHWPNWAVRPRGAA